MKVYLDHIIFEYDKQHPYKISFVLALALMTILLFYSSSVKILEDAAFSDKIQFINIDSIKVPGRIARKAISTEKGEIGDSDQIQRASGSGDPSDTVDLAFYPNITVPQPISRLKKIYPKSARELGVEAELFLEILIDTNGIVRKINFVQVRLSKDLPYQARLKLISDFQKDAYKIFKDSRWTPSIIFGKKVPVKYLLPLKFRLE